MLSKIAGGRVILPDEIKKTNVYFENGKIIAVTNESLPCGEIIDAGDRYVSPGFIEMHCHGGGGADFLDGTPEAFLTASELHAKHGATTVVPTATSGETGGVYALHSAWESACKHNKRGADMPGIHLEGPYFAPGQAGAQDPRHLRNPDPKEYNEILDRCPGILRWSAAPELPDALELGRELEKRGILAAIGHSDAEYADVEKAWDAGYTHVTHLYSGMSMLHRKNAYRYLGVVESAFLIDDMTVEIIADGCHLPGELLRLIYKFKGADKIALITDSMRGAGMPDGPSVLGHFRDGLPVIIEDGVAKLPDRASFAGSVATFDRLVRNMHTLAGVPLIKVIDMAARTPARIMGFKDRGEIKAGLRADLAIFDDDITVSRVIVGGNTVYSKGDD